MEGVEWKVSMLKKVCYSTCCSAGYSQTDNKTLVPFLFGSLFSLLHVIVLLMMGILAVACETAFRIGCSIGFVRYVTFLVERPHDFDVEGR